MNEKFLAYLFAWAVDRIVTAIMNSESGRENYVNLVSYLELNETADILIERFNSNGE